MTITEVIYGLLVLAGAGGISAFVSARADKRRADAEGLAIETKTPIEAEALTVETMTQVLKTVRGELSTMQERLERLETETTEAVEKARALSRMLHTVIQYVERLLEYIRDHMPGHHEGGIPVPAPALGEQIREDLRIWKTNGG